MMVDCSPLGSNYLAVFSPESTSLKASTCVVPVIGVGGEATFRLKLRLIMLLLVFKLMRLDCPWELKL